VLFSKDKTWKIADFGLATDGEVSGWAVAEDRYARGSGGYRAVELLRENSTFNNKTDIWAFGCIVFEVISGGERMFNDDWNVFRYGEDHSAGGEDAARMEGMLNKWMNSMVGNIQHRNWVVTTLLKTIDVDPSARPTATELKGVLHEIMKAGRTSPATQRASRRVILRSEVSINITS
jgi:serine/threonine protein kinase